jgi:hypothetical protein
MTEDELEQMKARNRAWLDFAKPRDETPGETSKPPGEDENPRHDSGQTPSQDKLENAGYPAGNSRAKGGRFYDGIRVKPVENGYGY